MTIPQPDVHRRPGLPASVSIYEVGPRDGLQNESSLVPLETKLEFIERLVDAGLRTVEATSFVSPRWVPQLADAGDLFPRLPAGGGGAGGGGGGGGAGGGGGGGGAGGVRYPVLVPNLAGLERAAAAGVTDIAVFAAATETFSRRNLNRGLDEAIAMFQPVVTGAHDRGMRVRTYLSMCFGDPWEGHVPVDRVVQVAGRLAEQGTDELCIADTIGVATPGHVHDLLGALAAAGLDPGDLAVHFHDTYGQALSNTVAALEAGVRTVDSSAGGLGGCPFAESATGNLATEDLVWMLHGLGVETGVDLARLVAASVWMAGRLGRPSPSRVVRALAGRLP